MYALKRLEEKGIKKMILTPHFMKDYSNNNRESITAEFVAFQKEAKESCEIELHLAGEYMLDNGFLYHFRQGFLTLDSTGKHVLCETSYMMYDLDYADMLYEIMCEDYQPVIAHPERYEYAGKDVYLNWKDKMYMFQLNLLSLAGVYGEHACQKSHFLLNEGMYDYVGSDMHNLDSFRRFIPEIRLNKKELQQLELLIDNNRRLTE